MDIECRLEGMRDNVPGAGCPGRHLVKKLNLKSMSGDESYSSRDKSSRSPSPRHRSNEYHHYQPHRHHHHRHVSHESSYTSPQRPLKHRHHRSHESSDGSQHIYSHAMLGGYSSQHYSSHRDNSKGRSAHKIDQGTLNITKPRTKGK